MKRMILGVMILVTACIGGVGTPEVAGSPAPFPTPAPSPTATPLPPPTHMVICIDRSGSYQEWTRPALLAIADLIPELVTSGAGWRIDIRWIEANSYRPEAHIGTFELPPLPPLPGPMPTFTPWPTPENPLERYEPTREAQATRQAAAEASLTATREWIQRSYQDAHRKALEFAETIRRLQPEVAQRSDIWGCLIKASELFVSRPNSERWLIIASDMEEAGTQQKNSLKLHGVHVRIVFWKATKAAQARQLRELWTQRFQEAGAADVGFFDPSLGLDPIRRELLQGGKP
ncbi:hypothetical protein [Thermoflexus hugenholtzii]